MKYDVLSYSVRKSSLSAALPKSNDLGKNVKGSNPYSALFLKFISSPFFDVISLEFLK